MPEVFTLLAVVIPALLIFITQMVTLWQAAEIRRENADLRVKQAEIHVLVNTNFTEQKKIISDMQTKLDTLRALYEVKKTELAVAQAKPVTV